MTLCTKIGKDSIFADTGLSVEQIRDMDFDEIDSAISKKIGKKISGYVLNDGLPHRGQVYLSGKRFLTIEEAEKGLSKHDKRKSRFIRKCLRGLFKHR